jgi:hypothetical protein
VLLDRAVSHWDSLAKNAAARFKKSRSCFKTSFSRLSRRALPVPPCIDLSCVALLLGLLLLRSPAVEQMVGNA